MNTAEQSMVDLALSIARQAHEGQLDKAGVDYIKHPIYVASQVESEEEKAVALLHDVLEDSSITAEELLIAGLPVEVVTAVQVLTKKLMQTQVSHICGMLVIIFQLLKLINLNLVKLQLVQVEYLIIL